MRLPVSVIAVIRWLEPDDIAVVSSVLGLARLFQGNGDYLVDWDGAEPTGHVHVAWSDPPELQDLEVCSEYQRQGIATSLIASVEATCRRRGCSRLHVMVSDRNDGARALYEHLGYARANIPVRKVVGIIEIRTGPIEVDDVLLTLEKPLDRGSLSS